MTNSPVRRLLRAASLVWLSDACFAMASGAIMRATPPARVWQGVASVPLGKAALDGGAAMVVAGLILHFCVALTWSALLLALLLRSYRLRAILDSTYGPLKIASVYGPLIWLVMSVVVMPAFTHRPTSFTSYWAVQLVGHVVFVALPMAWALRER